MKASTASRLMQAIQLLKLDGYSDYTIKQLSSTSGVAKKTIQRNSKLIDIFDFVLDRSGYNRCLVNL